MLYEIKIRAHYVAAVTVCVHIFLFPTDSLYFRDFHWNFHSKRVHVERLVRVNWLYAETTRNNTLVFFPATHTFTLIPVRTGTRKYFTRRNRCWNTFVSTCTSTNIPCHTQVTTQIPNNARSVTRSHKEISIGYLFGRKERLSSARFVP